MAADILGSVTIRDRVMAPIIADNARLGEIVTKQYLI